MNQPRTNYRRTTHRDRLDNPTQRRHVYRCAVRCILALGRWCPPSLSAWASAGSRYYPHYTAPGRAGDGILY